MLWNILLAIGILLVINGVVLTHQGLVVEKVRAAISPFGEIVIGSHKGLLFLTTTAVMMAVSPKGIIKKAKVIRSGYLRRTRSIDLPVEGRNLLMLSPEDVAGDVGLLKACKSALFRFDRK